jgi:AcrR family transcriptional regulator
VASKEPSPERRQRSSSARVRPDEGTVQRRERRVPVDQAGRTLGPRALRTRRKILDATAGLLRERSVLDLPVVDIARRAGTSPATFYHYFRDVEEVALGLAERANDEVPALLRLIAGSWKGREGLERARAIVDAFLRHWDAHHAVLHLRNLAADRGDRRFMRARRDALAPLLDAFSREIEVGRKEGRVPLEMNAYVAAAALCSILESLAAYHRELGTSGATREDLVETCARILYQTVTGRTARPEPGRGRAN